MHFFFFNNQFIKIDFLVVIERYHNIKLFPKRFILFQDLLKIINSKYTTKYKPAEYYLRRVNLNIRLSLNQGDNFSEKTKTAKTKMKRYQLLL